MIPIARESGMEIITIKEARIPKGRSVMATNNMAIKKSLNKPLSLSLTWLAWSKLTTKSILDGKVFLKFSMTGR